MRIFTLFLLLLAFSKTVPAQDFQSAVNDFSNNTELKHALIGFSLTDDTGQELASLNSEYSLAPASTQKMLTSVTALKLLGPDHKFVTGVSIVGSIEDGVLHGNVIIKSGGDPTLGSQAFKDHYGNFIGDWVAAIQAEGITEIEGKVLVDDNIFKTPRHAGSTSISDVGNYYGAGAPGFSFMDNEFTVFFNTYGNGTSSDVVRTEPSLPKNVSVINEVTAGNVKGDNVIIYSLENSTEVFLKGELPPNRSEFKVRGAIPNVNEFAQEYITQQFSDAGLNCRNEELKGPLFSVSKEIHRTKSPELIDILGVLMKKSNNSYADVIFKHIGLATHDVPTFEAGAKAVKAFWQKQGIDVSGIHLEDGSGLSRKNNVTAAFMTSVMAKVSGDKHVIQMMDKATSANSIKSMWGGTPTGFIQAKSGYIGRVRAYGGYLLKDSVQYPFYLTVNNYHGNSGKIRKLMGEMLKECQGLLA